MQDITFLDTMLAVQRLFFNRRANGSVLFNVFFFQMAVHRAGLHPVLMEGHQLAHCYQLIPFGNQFRDGLFHGGGSGFVNVMAQHNHAVFYVFHHFAVGFAGAAGAREHHR